MSGTRVEHERNMRRTRVEHKRNTNGTRTEHEKNTSGTRAEHERNTSGTRVERGQNMSRTRAEHEWNMRGTCCSWLITAARVLGRSCTSANFDPHTFKLVTSLEPVRRTLWLCGSTQTWAHPGVQVPVIGGFLYWALFRCSSTSLGVTQMTC